MIDFTWQQQTSLPPFSNIFANPPTLWSVHIPPTTHTYNPLRSPLLCSQKFLLSSFTFFVFAVFTFFLHFWSFVKYIVSSLFITCPFSDFIPSFAPSYYTLFFALLLPLLSLSFPSRSLVDPSSTSGDFICSEHPITTKFRNILLCMLAPPQSRSATCIC